MLRCSGLGAWVLGGKVLGLGGLSFCDFILGCKGQGEKQPKSQTVKLVQALSDFPTWTCFRSRV